MNGVFSFRRLRPALLPALLLALAGLAACGQMGPLQLPADATPVTGDAGQDEDSEDDER
jgi:predicted small lipoprotein YifL